MSMRRLAVLLAATLLASARSASAQLPTPTNPNLARFGYYFVNEKNGDSTSSVWSYTNIYVAIPSNAADSTATFSQWQSAFTAQLDKATFNHKAIYLGLGGCGITGSCGSGVTWDTILDVAANYWNQVVWVEVAAEENLSTADMQARVNLLNTKLAARGLSGRSPGAIFTRDQLLGSAPGVYASGLNWVNIEAYEPCTAADCSIQNASVAAVVADLNAYLATAKNYVANAGKQIFLTGQAYDRNFLWTNMTTLEATQRPVYLNAYNDNSVIGILMFSYNRAGGTKDHPFLRQAHCEIAAAMGIGIGCNYTILTGGSVIGVGGAVASPSGQYVLTYQSDGNFVLYSYGSPVWAINCWFSCSSTGLFGNPYQPAGWGSLQTDGNLVTYNAYGQPTFTSWTNGNPSAYLAIGNDGSLTVRSPTGAVLWSR
jgi:hypothetical protein